MAHQPNLPTEEQLRDFWFDEIGNAVHCPFCGNSGVIDTRATAITCAGHNVGRLSWCICPNGRKAKQHHGPTLNIEDYYQLVRPSRHV